MYAATQAAFRTEADAYRFVEERVWPDGPVCPHCSRSDRVGRLMGKDPKPGAYKCYACRKPFNVKLGTMLESSHVPLHLWLQALFLLQACEHPVSVNRLHRIMGVSSRTTWLLSQRFRDRLADFTPGASGGMPPASDVAASHEPARDEPASDEGPSRSRRATGGGTAADHWMPGG